MKDCRKRAGLLTKTIPVKYGIAYLIAAFGYAMLISRWNVRIMLPVWLHDLAIFTFLFASVPLFILSSIGSIYSGMSLRKNNTGGNT